MTTWRRVTAWLISFVVTFAEALPPAVLIGALYLILKTGAAGL